MDVTLNKYITRAKELQGKNDDESKTELKMMLHFLNKAITAVELSLSNPQQLTVNYDAELNRHSIKIGSSIIHGEIGNIYYTRRTPRQQTIECKFGNECLQIQKEKKCKFYHEPSELLKLVKNKVISQQFYEETIKCTRNFENTSWMYTSNGNRPYMRQFGSKIRLKYDLTMLFSRPTKTLEINTFKAQLAHDILLFLELEKFANKRNELL